MQLTSLKDLQVTTISRITKHINCPYLYWVRAKNLYEITTGRTLSYRSPKTLSEKLMWLTRYWQHPLKTRCSDKYQVREYIREKGLGKLLIPMIALFDNAEDIDLDKLPNSFILKSNHASGWNIIVENKNEINKYEILSKINSFLNNDFSRIWCEKHYDGIVPKIVCEELISPTAPTEYQCWCINGEPESLLVCRKNHDGTYNAYSYSCDYRQLYDRIGEKKNEGVLEAPHCLNDILSYSRILSKDFPFVRTDFYEVDGTVYFAELTFTPDKNYLLQYSQSFQERLGSKLVLPEKYV